MSILIFVDMRVEFRGPLVDERRGMVPQQRHLWQSEFDEIQAGLQADLRRFVNVRCGWTGTENSPVAPPNTLLLHVSMRNSYEYHVHGAHVNVANLRVAHREGTRAV